MKEKLFKINSMNVLLIAEISLCINIILGICLLSPNIVYLIHKKWFEWKK